MAENPRANKTIISFEVDITLAERIKAAAKNAEQSVSGFIRKAARKAISNSGE